jgi:hypothetical protein
MTHKISASVHGLCSDESAIMALLLPINLKLFLKKFLQEILHFLPLLFSKGVGKTFMADKPFSTSLTAHSLTSYYIINLISTL